MDTNWRVPRLHALVVLTLPTLYYLLDEGLSTQKEGRLWAFLTVVQRL